MNLSLRFPMLSLLRPAGLAVAFLGTSAMAVPVEWEEVIALSARPADAQISYGRAAAQFGELRLPAGAGPHPVAVLIHGGCWQAEFDLHHTAPLAAALARAGIATWTLEYRRLGDPGGGWPGTFEDVAAGVNELRRIATRHPLDLERVILIGHSAGGQLALWAASTARDQGAGLVRPTLPLRGVVALAAITDLRAFAAEPGGCSAAVPRLLGGMPADVPARTRDVSPIELLPLGTPTRLIHGELDPIVPLEQSRAFAARAVAGKNNSELVVVEDAGHFDFLQPSSPAFAELLRAARELFQIRGKP